LKAALRIQVSAVVMEAVNQAVQQETETSRSDSPTR
jgi:hypothetical protein